MTTPRLRGRCKGQDGQRPRSLLEGSGGEVGVVGAWRVTEYRLSLGCPVEERALNVTQVNVTVTQFFNLYLFISKSIFSYNRLCYIIGAI